MASLALTNVSKIYPNGFESVRNLSFELADGEFAILTGPSGVGKSTVMRVVSGMEKVNDGKIWIDGQIVNELEPVDRGIAMVFANYMLYPRMTVYENVGLGLRLRGINEEEIYRRTVATMELLGILDIRKERVRTLPDDQRHRVALARAFILEPGVLLMDDPLRNVDEKYHEILCHELVALQASTKTTILYASRNLEEMKILRKRKIIMK